MAQGRTNDTHCSVPVLKERGWTDSLIRDLLGEPDTLRKNPRFASAAPMRLYEQARVHTVEQSEKWVELQEKASKRRGAAQKASQTKREQLLAYVNTLTISVPKMPLRKATKNACFNWNQHKQDTELDRLCEGRDCREWEPSSLESSAEHLQRITVNYLRHEMTNYEEQLEQTYGKVGVREAYILINEKVYAAISAAYPPLSDECKHQLEEKVAQISAESD